MVPALLTRTLTSALIGLGLSISTPAISSAVDLDEALMTDAVRYLGVLRGHDMSTEEGDWLKQRWREEFAASPGAVFEQLDDLAFSFQRHRQEHDPLALANGRTDILKNAYCVARQTSDPIRRRLKDILAPKGVVLAADCVLGLVVTRFDVDGLSASHALTASATGQSHDPDGDRAEIVATIEKGFADAAPAEKSLIANGELRHAVLARFWSRIDGAPEQRAVIEEVRSAAAADPRGTARQLEKLALSRLGEVDYLAKIGDARLTAAAIDAYTQWLERIAGFPFSGRDRGWLQQAIVDEFQDDPNKTLGDVAGITEMNRAYSRSGSGDEKAAMVAGWAASLYCFLSASRDPDEARLADVIFSRDPVTNADCQAGRVVRRSDAVLAEADGQRLTERDVSASLRFVSIVLGRPLLPEEEALIRDDNIQSFDGDQKAWREEIGFYREFLAKVEPRRDTIFLAVDERKKLFDPIFCFLKESDDAFADDYIDMFHRAGEIVFEDCERQRVTTRGEIDAVVSLANFLALLNDRPPLSEADVEDLWQSLNAQNLDQAESSMSAVNEWWSLLTLEEKAAEALKARENGIVPEADGETIAKFINGVKLQVVLKNANRKLCRMNAIIAQGNAAIFAAKQGRNIYTDNGDPVGFPGEEYATLVTTNNMFASFCKGS